MDVRFDVIVVGGGHAGCEAAAAGPHGRSDRPGDPSGVDHRGHVLQSGDRRSRQRPSGPRDRRPGRADGPRRRPRRHPVPRPQPAQGAGRPRPARPGGSPALCCGDAKRRPQYAESDGDRGRSGRSGAVGRTGFGPQARRRPHHRRRRGGVDDRHLPARPDPYRRPDDSGRPGGGGALDGVVKNAGTAGICPGAAEDRHPAAAGWPDHRLGAARNAAGR